MHFNAFVNFLVKVLIFVLLVQIKRPSNDSVKSINIAKINESVRS